MTFCSKLLPAPNLFPWKHSRSPDPSPYSTSVHSAHIEFLAHGQGVPPLHTIDLLNRHRDVVVPLPCTRLTLAK